MYDLTIKDHHNFVANNVVVHNCTSQGAQRLFMNAKPRSILDIAMLTSIYRPGPLAAKVDKLYLDAKNNGSEFDWGDKRINELLKETYGLLIFQEGVMMLAEKVAGFPKDKCDEVRRAIMKRSISGGDAAKAKVDEMKDEFVKGSMTNGYSEKVASDLYEKIAYFSGYAFNASHATAYAIDSYWCAWLLKHHEEQWLSAYLESMSATPENRAKAFGEVREMGYHFVDIDINHATASWTVLPGKQFMPSFLSCKGVGASAIDEIVANRPFKDVESMLWNEDGTWKHSKFNKRAMEALIKIKAFESLGCIGEDKQFASYHHMHEVIVENQDAIKKTPKKDPLQGRKAFYDLARERRSECPEWSKKELAEFQVAYFGTIDVTKMYPKRIAWCKQKDIRPIEELELGEEAIVWFCVESCTTKKSKAGKLYLQLQVAGPTGKTQRLNVWGWKDADVVFDPYEFNLSTVKRDDFGCSTGSWKLKRRIPELGEEMVEE